MVVTVGETEVEPKASTEPMPLLMVTVAPLLEFQSSQEDCPAVIVVGSAMSRAAGRGVAVKSTLRMRWLTVSAT